MRHGREFISLPVIDQQTGESLGEVSDLIIGPDLKVAALVVSPARGLFRSEKTVGLDRFTHIDESGAYLPGKKDLATDASSPNGWRLLARNDGLYGRGIYTQEGKELGLVGDVIFDDPALTLWGYEVSDGVFMDLLDGRPIVEGQGALILDDRIVLEQNGHV